MRASKAGIEALGDVAHKFDVLALVFSDRDLVGPVRKDIGGLKNRVQKEPCADELTLLRGFLLELRHAVEFAVGCDRAQQPAELGVLRDVPLAEKDALIGIEAGRRRIAAVS